MPSQRQKRELPASKKILLISQSLANDVANNDACPKYIKYKYGDQIEPDGGDEQNVMFRGRYFEWHLLGATRDGKEPEFTQLSKGRKRKDGSYDTRPQAQVDLDELIVYAREVLQELGLDVKSGDKQLYLRSEELHGHIDWRTNDIVNKDRRALFDVKYTETTYDDRWNGWANFETKTDSKFQATHYTILEYLTSNEFLPFYFLVFGKSKWCRVIKVELSQDGVSWHETTIARTKEKIVAWEEGGWPAAPEFNKCYKCGYFSICKDKAIVPEIEAFQI